MYDLLGDDFYTLAAGPIAQHLYEPGQFFDAPATYLLDQRPMYIVRARYNEGTGDHNYWVTQADLDSFKERHEPVKTLNLRSSDRGAIVGCKIRPVVLVSAATDRWSYGARSHDECYVVAPVYSFAGADEKDPYPEDFIRRVQAYAYNTYFYLPERASAPRFDEGFVRFDRLQVVHKKWLLHKKLSLGVEATECMLVWLSLYIANSVSSPMCGEDIRANCLPKLAKFIMEYRADRMRRLQAT